MSALRLRRGGLADEQDLLALFDEAVAWLVDRGLTGQWGSVPFSERPDMVARVHRLATDGGLWIAEQGTAVVGALVLGAAPDYAPAAHRSEVYVELLLTSRLCAGSGIGRMLVEAAVQIGHERGVRQLRVDCWAESARLVRWYEEVGFKRSGTFDLAGWRGQLLTMEIDERRPLD